MSFTRLASVLLALGLAAPVWAQEDVTCAKEVCIHTQQDRNGLTVFAVNGHRALPVSVKVNFDTTNMRIVRGSEDVFVLSGGERRFVLRLDEKRPGAWRWSYTFTWSRGDVTAKHDDSYLYRIPFSEGLAVKVMQSCFGTFSHTGPTKYAIDFGVREGTPIHAARGGIVVDMV